MEKTCCVTGHRRIAPSKTNFIKQELRREIEQAVKDGFIRFISGFAEGVDLEFAAIVSEIKESNPAIFLEAALPYSGRMKTKCKLFHQLIEKCNGVKTVSNEHHPDCYLARNRYMVDKSERVIAVFNGRSRSGTAQTIRLAMAKGCDLRVIDISE